MKLKRILTVMLAGIMLLSITACNKENKNPEVKPTVNPNEEEATVIEAGSHINISDKGYFVMTNQGIEPEFTSAENTKVVLYTDALCGDCIRLHHNAKDFFEENIHNGMVELKIIPLDFLGEHRPDDYSLRSSALTLLIAEKYPNKVDEFMGMLYSEEFKPEKDQTTPNEKFINLLIQAGVADAEADEVVNQHLDEYIEIVKGSSEGIRENEELLSLSPLDRVFVPFLYVEGTNRALLGESEDTEGAIIKPLMEQISAYGEGIEPCEDEVDGSCND